MLFVCDGGFRWVAMRKTRKTRKMRRLMITKLRMKNYRRRK